MINKILFLSITLFLFACGNPANHSSKLSTRTPGIATINGKMTTPNGNTMELSANGESSRVSIENGSFTLPKDLTEAGYFDLKNGNQSTQIFLVPGYNLGVQSSGRGFARNIAFTGDGAKENTFLKSRLKLEKENLPARQSNYQLPESEFINKIEGYRKAMTENLDNYIAANKDLDPEFIALEKLHIQYDCATEYFQYPQYNSTYTQDKDKSLSPELIAFRDQINLSDELAIKLKSYQRYVIYEAYKSGDQLYQKTPALQADENGSTLAILQVVNEKFNSAKVKDFLSFNILNDHIRYRSINDLNLLVGDFVNTTQNSTYKQVIQSQVNRWAPLNKGQVAPTFAYRDIKGQNIDLKDLIGKNVYIDIWATWCGPCKREIPHLEALQEQYKENSNIVFASVSIDKNKEAWEKMVKEKDMKGLQLYAENANNSKICRDYMVSGIPRFLLIDTEGKIINAKAPRPSSPEIKTILANLSKG